MLDTIVNMIRKAAKKYPNAIYRSPAGKGGACFYTRGEVENGPPREGCIFREAVEKFFYHDLTTEKSIEYILYETDEDHVTSWLAEVQLKQDHGQTWGEAVASADKYYP